MTNSASVQAIIALRNRIALLADPWPIELKGQTDFVVPGDGRYLSEEPVGGTQDYAELGTPGGNRTQYVEQYQLNVFAPKGIGYFAQRNMAETLALGIRSAALVLADNVTRLFVHSAQIMSVRDDVPGRPSQSYLPVVVLYEFLY